MTVIDRLSAELDIINAIDLFDAEMMRATIAMHAATGLDAATLFAKARVLTAARVCFDGPRFDAEIQGLEPEPAFIVDVLDAQERRLDLLAWPIGRPREMATLHGVAVLLGQANFDAYWPGLSEPLRVHRTAEAWLKAGCQGCVPICRQRAARMFADMGGEILADDDAHGAELWEDRQALLTSCAILVREAA